MIRGAWGSAEGLCEPEANTTNLLGANLTISPMRRE